MKKILVSVALLASAMSVQNVYGMEVSENVRALGRAVMDGDVFAVAKSINTTDVLPQEVPERFKPIVLEGALKLLLARALELSGEFDAGRASEAFMKRHVDKKMIEAADALIKADVKLDPKDETVKEITEKTIAKKAEMETRLGGSERLLTETGKKVEGKVGEEYESYQLAISALEKGVEKLKRTLERYALIMSLLKQAKNSSF